MGVCFFGRHVLVLEWFQRESKRTPSQSKGFPILRQLQMKGHRLISKSRRSLVAISKVFQQLILGSQSVTILGIGAEPIGLDFLIGDLWMGVGLKIDGFRWFGFWMGGLLHLPGKPIDFSKSPPMFDPVVELLGHLPRRKPGIPNRHGGQRTAPAGGIDSETRARDGISRADLTLLGKIHVGLSQNRGPSPPKKSKHGNGFCLVPLSTLRVAG